MMRTYKVAAYPQSPQTVVLDANGEGRMTPIGPDMIGEVWDQLRYSTVCESACTVTVYKNSETSANIIDTTVGGINNTSDQNTDLTLQSGEKLIFVATRGKAGAQWTIFLEGRGRLP